MRESLFGAALAAAGPLKLRSSLSPGVVLPVLSSAAARHGETGGLAVTETYHP